MAENHPVAFQWVIEAKLKGAEVVHVDPRFTRTSANATRHLAIRPGSDIALLGGLIRHVLETESDFREYVLAYTNAATLLRDDFQDTEDLDGLFSGWDAQQHAYERESWAYREATEAGGGGARSRETAIPHSAGSHGPTPGTHPEPPQDPTLQDPRCVYQVLRRHFARYTPQMVERVTGVSQEAFSGLAEAICRNSGRERTTALVYSVGWTQHTKGVQVIRAGAILQLLLGNIGRPGGGILALRGHASIQGSTDIPTLYSLLPGYLPMPDARDRQDLDAYVEANTTPAGYWGHMRSFVVSLLKAYYGDAASADNQFGWGLLPRLTGDHGIYRAVLDMLDGRVKGFFLVGENPAVGSANSKLHRLALARLDWLVVRDLVEIESAAFWYDSPEVRSGELRTEEIPTEVFLLPAAAHTEKAGTFTNTQRLLQWREKAVEPPGDCRSDLWFYYHLGRVIRQKLAGSRENRDRGILSLAWEYPTEGPARDPSAESVLREISGTDGAGRPLSGFSELRDDGSTSCGCWIYSGVFKDGINQAARRKPHTEQNRLALDWGWAWPANRRVLYNRASAAPDGRPWSERKRLVWWDAEAGRWAGEDVPDFKVDMPPDYRPAEGARAELALAGDEPFIMQADGRGWLFAPSGAVDGPLPTHYEPEESPVENVLYRQRANPAREEHDRPLNRHHAPGAPEFPYVFTTYRLTEHHTAGGMSRFIPYLSELQPEMFVEVSPALAAERGLEHAGWCVVETARAAIEARVLVTDRVRPLRLDGRIVHQVGLPYHWGSRGLVTGSSANDLLPIVLDPNVHIQEAKAATCNVRPGRLARDAG